MKKLQIDNAIYEIDWENRKKAYDNVYYSLAKVSEPSSWFKQSLFLEKSENSIVLIFDNENVFYKFKNFGNVFGGTKIIPNSKYLAQVEDEAKQKVYLYISEPEICDLQGKILNIFLSNEANENAEIWHNVLKNIDALLSQKMKILKKYKIKMDNLLDADDVIVRKFDKEEDTVDVYIINLNKCQFMDSDADNKNIVEKNMYNYWKAFSEGLKKEKGKFKATAEKFVEKYEEKLE
jgi:hypothetical protein